MKEEEFRHCLGGNDYLTGWIKLKFEDCKYKTKEKYCKPEDCETCEGVTEESIEEFDNYMKKKRGDADNW